MENIKLKSSNKSSLIVSHEDLAGFLLGITIHSYNSMAWFWKVLGKAQTRALDLEEKKGDGDEIWFVLKVPIGRNFSGFETGSE